MGGLSSFLFGDKPTQSNQQLPTLNPQQTTLLNQLIAQMSASPDVAGAGNTSAPYNGALTTDLSPLQSTSLAAMEEAAMQRVRGPTPGQTTAMNTVQSMQNLDPNQQMSDFNTYFKGAVEDPTIAAFKRDVIPDLSRRYSGSATFSSDRRAAEADTSNQLAQQLSSARASGFFNYLNTNKQNALQAAGMTPALESAPINDLTTLLAGGGVPTQLNQQNLQNLYAEFVRQMSAKQGGLQNALALLGIKPFENVVTQTPGTPGFLTSLAGGAGQGAGAALTKWALSA